MNTRAPCQISVIIVNYNTAHLLGPCLRSIASEKGAALEVVVVDNASEDHSVELVKTEFPWVTLITNKTNLGFARANNQALKVSRGDYIHFLNPDTVVQEGLYKRMISFMDAHPEIGLAGTKVLNPDHSLQSSVQRHYPGERHTTRELKGLKGDIAWVMGASMIGRRALMEALGGFDGRFFLYGEDVDLCLRVRKAGWAIGYIGDAAVVHWGGQSERNNLPLEVWEKKLEAEFLFYRTHYADRTIRRIERKDLIQALWRILTLKLSLLLSSHRDARLDKLEKYQLVAKKIRSGQCRTRRDPTARRGSP